MCIRDRINKHQGILQKICNIYFYRNPYKEDYHQEMLIRLWKSFPGFKNQSAFSTWLYRVALNTAIDIIRKQNLQPKHLSLIHISEPTRRTPISYAVFCLKQKIN